MTLFGLPSRKSARTSRSRGVKLSNASLLSSPGSHFDPFCRSWANLINILAGTKVPPAATYWIAAPISDSSMLVVTRQRTPCAIALDDVVHVVAIHHQHERDARHM